MATCSETGLEADMVDTTGGMAVIIGVGVEVFGAEIEQTMEEVLAGEALLPGAGEEEEVLLQAQLPVLVQGLHQALGAPGGAEDSFSFNAYL